MATKIVVPDLGESVVEATVARWLKQEGDSVSVGDVLVELETEKVDLEVGADKTGVLARIERQEGEDVEVGDVLGVIEAGDGAAAEEDESAPEVEEEAEAEDGEAEKEESATDGKVTPLARRLAAEHGVDIAQISGTGSGGRVTKRDVESYLAGQKDEQETVEEAEKPEEVKETAEEQPAREQPEPAVDASRREERVRMSRRRRTIAQRLVEAQHTAAMLTTFNEINMSAVMDLRQRRREAFEKRHGVRLGFMSFFVKAVIGALKEFPQLNAELDGNEIVLKHYYDIGIAIGAAEGLIVPVLRDADRMSFAGVERTIREFAQKAEEGSLSLDDLRGGTFTITNGGVFGSLLSTPILNIPQVGILGMHKIEERPIAVNDELVIRPMMYVALSYDHRVVDGRESVQFLVRVKEMIEDPETLLLEG